SKLVQLLPERPPKYRAPRSSAWVEDTYAEDFPWLLRLNWNAQRNEHSGKDNDRDFFLHVFPSSLHSTLLTRPSFSLDHLVRSCQYVGRNRQADLLGSFQIDDELEFHRLLNGKIGRLGSLQDSIHVVCDAPVAVCEVRPVGHEPTGFYPFSAAVHRR